MADINLGATYTARELADGDAEHFARFGIISEVIEEPPHPGSHYRRWRVNVYVAQSVPKKVEPVRAKRRTA